MIHTIEFLFDFFLWVTRNDLHYPCAIENYPYLYIKFHHWAKLIAQTYHDYLGSQNINFKLEWWETKWDYITLEEKCQFVTPIYNYKTIVTN
jgi:hypothetical protein